MIDMLPSGEAEINKGFEEIIKEGSSPRSQKYSRYLSVKRATANSDAQFDFEAQKMHTVQNESNDMRSISRYRKLRNASKEDPTLEKSVLQDTNHLTELIQGINTAKKSRSSLQTSQEANEDVVLQRQVGQETNRQDDKESGSTNCEISTHSLTSSQFMELKERDLQRLRTHLDAAHKFPPNTIQRRPKTQSKIGGFFFIRRESKCASRNSCERPFKSIMTNSNSEFQQSKNIEQGGGGVVPQTDAPISAINAGERRVLVRFKQSSINLQVTHETTPVDLIQSAANMLDKDISTSSTIMLESFTHLGLERPVRNYEHIRDVLNSWDRDTQNSFILEQQFNINNERLEAGSVPKEAPASVTVNVFYSQKSGKWKRRYVTLLSSGQIFVAKHVGAKSTDKDYQNICHLSDFDIYTSLSERARKKYNPPEKNFYAIKSQQRTTMFVSSPNYVHYFSIQDDAVGQRLYNAVQRWRSWFLVNYKYGVSAKTNHNQMNQSDSTRSNISTDHEHKVLANENTDSQVDFQSHIDLNNRSHQETIEKARSRHSVIENYFPQMSINRFTSNSNPPLSYKASCEESEFPSSSLLGRTYSQRKRELQEETINQQRSAIASITKANCVFEEPRGLVDLTTTLKEPPQWNCRSKGHGVRAMIGLPLVDLACSPRLSPQSVETPRLNNLLNRKDSKFSQKSGRQLIAAKDEGPFVKGGLISALVNSEGRTTMKSKTAISTLPLRPRY